MTFNILDAIMNIVASNEFNLKSENVAKNRANSMGDALENYIKDAFAGTLGDIDTEKLHFRYGEVFSYLGNSNNPPDMMLRDGDAIEVKKIESDDNYISLGKRHPLQKIYASDPFVNRECVDCEKWEEKDVLYAVCSVKNGLLKSIMFVYGEHYAGSRESYDRAEKDVKHSVESLYTKDNTNDNELYRVNKVDNLGITFLSVKVEMSNEWHIRNPKGVFEYIYKEDEDKSFNMAAILSEEKFLSFCEEDVKVFEDFVKNTEGLEISNIQVRNPSNPAKLIKSRLISYKR